MKNFIQDAVTYSLAFFLTVPVVLGILSIVLLPFVGFVWLVQQIF